MRDVTTLDKLWDIFSASSKVRKACMYSGCSNIFKHKETYRALLTILVPVLVLVKDAMYSCTINPYMVHKLSEGNGNILP